MISKILTNKLQKYKSAFLFLEFIINITTTNFCLNLTLILKKILAVGYFLINLNIFLLVVVVFINICHHDLIVYIIYVY